LELEVDDRGRFSIFAVLEDKGEAPWAEPGAESCCEGREGVESWLFDVEVGRVLGTIDLDNGDAVERSGVGYGRVWTCISQSIKTT
jgi:hypothetical protein